MSKLNWTPTDGRVIVEPEEAVSKVGSIVLPDSAKKKPQRGKVIAAGLGRILENGSRSPMPCSEGQTVLFGEWAGSEFEFDGKKVRIIDAHDILATSP